MAMRRLTFAALVALAATSPAHGAPSCTTSLGGQATGTAACLSGAPDAFLLASQVSSGDGCTCTGPDPAACFPVANPSSATVVATSPTTLLAGSDIVVSATLYAQAAASSASFAVAVSSAVDSGFAYCGLFASQDYHNNAVPSTATCTLPFAVTAAPLFFRFTASDHTASAGGDIFLTAWSTTACESTFADPAVEILHQNGGLMFQPVGADPIHLYRLDDATVRLTSSLDVVGDLKTNGVNVGEELAALKARPLLYSSELDHPLSYPAGVGGYAFVDPQMELSIVLDGPSTVQLSYAMSVQFTDTLADEDRYYTPRLLQSKDGGADVKMSPQCGGEERGDFALHTVRNMCSYNLDAGSYVFRVQARYAADNTVTILSQTQSDWASTFIQALVWPH